MRPLYDVRCTMYDGHSCPSLLLLVVLVMVLVLVVLVLVVVVVLPLLPVVPSAEECSGRNAQATKGKKRRRSATEHSVRMWTVGWAFLPVLSFGILRFFGLGKEGCSGRNAQVTERCSGRNAQAKIEEYVAKSVGTPGFEKILKIFQETMTSRVFLSERMNSL